MVQTDAYRRLDPSEKSAVSYFLGMTQAKITCELLLGIPHLLHVDAVLALLGHKTRASRPDLVGVDPTTNTYTIAVEAKGRSNGKDEDAIRKAKKQAGLMPRIVGTTSDVCVASLAYFGDRDRWEAYLEDPEWPYEQVEDVDIETLLVAYYRPVVASVLRGIERRRDHEGRATAYVPAIDLDLGVPEVIVDALSDLAFAREIPREVVQTQGALVRSAVSDLVPALPGGMRVAPESTVIAAEEDEDPRSCTGLDGVRVVLGRTWFDEAG